VADSVGKRSNSEPMVLCACAGGQGKVVCERVGECVVNVEEGASEDISKGWSYVKRPTSRAPTPSSSHLVDRSQLVWHRTANSATRSMPRPTAAQEQGVAHVPASNSGV
jgi:hypothetical protein